MREDTAEYEPGEVAQMDPVGRLGVAIKQINRLREDRATINKWMREPDYCENASLEWLTEWVNRRPLAACQ